MRLLFIDKMNHAAADDQADLVVTQDQGQDQEQGQETVGDFTMMIVIMTKDGLIGGN